MTRNPTTDSLEAALRGTATDPSTDLTAALARAEAEDLVDVAYTVADSPIGPLLVAATPSGLVRLGFQTEDRDRILDDLAQRVSPRVLEAPARLDEARRELDEYFEGRRDHFELPLDWQLSRGFRKTVLERLHADVQYGRTVSYLELATMVGNPKASRAVGTAMATNPIPIVVPCHRVVRTGGALGGYGGGLDVKRWLLDLEGSGNPQLELASE
jgi:methylated-DNA-[protein]-cysteine S-methyltransferase